MAKRRASHGRRASTHSWSRRKHRSPAKKLLSRFGLIWSWKRMIGLTVFKQKISRKTHIPFTRNGRQRKLGRWLGL